MPKVDLEKIEIGFSPITDEVFIGTMTRTGLWNNKVPFKNKFLDIVINFGKIKLK